MYNKIKLTLILAIGMYFISGCNNGTTTTHDMEDSPHVHIDSMDHTDMHNMDTHMDTSMMSAMNNMNNSMKDIMMSGDFDLDFAKMMTAHHQGAINMAEMEISKGSNAEIKLMAGNIVKAQQEEIEQFKNILKDYKMSEMKKEGGQPHNELRETMEKMHAKMKGMSMTGNADKDFVMMMIPHHESAVTMAEGEISYGKKPAIKKMAQKIVDGQGKEIKQFQEWLSKNK